MCPRAENEDAAGGWAIERQTTERVPVGQRHRRRGKVWTVVVDDRDIGVHDGDGRAPIGEHGEIVCAQRRRIVGVEIEHRRDVRRRENDVHVGRGDIAVDGTVVDGDLDDAVSSGNARGVEDHLVQGRLIVRERGRAAEREDAGEGIVARSRDAGRQCPGDKRVARLPVDVDRDPGRLDRRAVGVGDGNVGVGDRYRQPAVGECRGIVRPAAIGVVGVEIEVRRNGGTRYA